MTDKADAARRQPPKLNRHFQLTLYQLGVVVATLGVLTFLITSQRYVPRLSLIVPWAALVAVVSLLPIPFWRTVELGMDFPILIAAGFLFSPLAAALIALVGSFDPRELRREVSPSQALFNRSQVASSVMVASMVFHRLASLWSSIGVMVGAALVSAVVDYSLNTAFVAVRVSLAYGLRLLAVLRKMHTGRPAELIVSDSALAIVGIVLAHLYLRVGFWS